MWHLKWNFKLSHTLTSASLTNAVLNEEMFLKYQEGAVDYTPFIPNPNLGIISPSSFSQREVSEYQIDYNAELYRKQHDETKLYPSRFACIFAFGSLEAAQKAADFCGWSMDSVKKFRLNESFPTRVVKVNMQVISEMWAIGNGAVFDQAENEIIWSHYWRGGGELPLDIPDLKTGEDRETMNLGIIWEYLIDGQLEMVEE
ncbi:MAG: hypothetical protein WAZ21_00670 [Candidatus Saccharimonadales bacterium]